MLAASDHKLIPRSSGMMICEIAKINTRGRSRTIEDSHPRMQTRAVVSDASKGLRQ
jgi:hypothetical protein